MTFSRAVFSLVMILVLLAGCASTPDEEDAQPQPKPPVPVAQRPRWSPPNIAQIPDAVPHLEPFSKLGNPESYEVFGIRYYPLKSNKGFVEEGVASWYGPGFHGKKTSCGEPYDMYEMTAAHKTLPLPTYAEVTNLDNGRKIIVKINDRGPFHDDRIIDLSYVAAQKLDITEKGTGYVRVKAIDATSIEPASNYASQAPVSRPVSRTPTMTPKYFLQVGAFSDRGHAEQLCDRLDDVVQQSIQIRESFTATGQPVYRVHVGPLSSMEAADELIQKTNHLGLPNPKVVVN
jgi:rare lipoprotein A